MPVRRITVTESFAEIDLGERLFWDGGDLVGRAAVVESVAFDGAKPVLALRRAR